MKAVERKINEGTLGQLRQTAGSALEVLGLTERTPPKDVVNALDEFVDGWQQGKRDTANGEVLEAEDVPFAMGACWGEQLVRGMGWEWVSMKFENGSSAPGVVSPDRALVVYPIHFLIGCVENGVDVTAMLAWNMLEGGSVTGVAPNSYVNLMDGVHRIVPRR
jgi:hypothetical protein